MEMTLLVLQKPINHELITRTLKSLSNPCKPQRLIVSCQTTMQENYIKLLVSCLRAQEQT